ncbi:MAG: M48 family metalloprotease [Proteobacteria bacterium]|nr:M48 family metalloprotease [Pseudomonadota bacterium]
MNKLFLDRLGKNLSFTGENKNGRRVSRRQFLKYSAYTYVTFGTVCFLAGCAVDPVTGKNQLMMMSREQEIGIDKQHAPFQFSSDYGVTQDRALNQYIGEVGGKMMPFVHRPDMPYAFQCVNATYVNAYAFPGGSIAVTRGILLDLDDEAQLAALLGHELGHVNARHSAEQASKNQLSSLFVGGLSLLASTQGSGLGQLTQQLGALGQGLFLSSYSRENEREADSLGQEYMVKAGYSSKGFVGLMEMLNSMNTAKASSTQMLFSTHPMSSERLSAAVQRDTTQYKHTQSFPLGRERYMDKTALLRQKKGAILKMQEGEKYLAKEEYGTAETSFKSAIQQAPHDYTAHVLMAKCLLIQKKSSQALSYADSAKKLYATEPQGYYLAGLANSAEKKHTRAYEDFKQCDALLPGNPQVTFYKGYSLDNSGQQQAAAQNYLAYLKQINYQANPYSKHAYQRLKAWGYAQ